MTASQVDWPWQPADFSPTPERAAPSPDEIALLAARCFRGMDGNRFLAYLRGLTVERVLGPAANDAALRHLEGQRQLVHHIAGLVDQGRGAPGPDITGRPVRQSEDSEGDLA